MHVAILLYDGFDDLDGIGPFEVFSHAQHVGADLEVGVYTLAPQETVTSGHGLPITPDGTLPEAPDIVVVPGGGLSEADEDALPDALVRLHANGTTMTSVCTGGLHLARAGITDGRPAITHREALEDLEAAGAEVVEARVVDDGDLVTAGGVTAGIDLALHLVEREAGADIAERVATLMEYDRRDDVYVG